MNDDENDDTDLEVEVDDEVKDEFASADGAGSWIDPLLRKEADIDRQSRQEGRHDEGIAVMVEALTPSSAYREGRDS